jgi:hypothetical protein
MLKFILLIPAFIFFALCASAQSLFKPIPAPATHFGPRTNAIILGDTLTPGIDFTGFRLTGATALYSVNFKPFSVSSSAVTVLYGIDWEHDKWDAIKKRFYETFGIGLQGGLGGQLAQGTNPASLIGVLCLLISTQAIGNLELPFKLTVGIMRNFAAGTWMGAIGPGNGLNN